MGNHNGSKLDYKQEESEKILDRAKAEYQFSDRLYEILLSHQKGKTFDGRGLREAPPGNVGELNSDLSRLYNLIWSAALPLNDKARSKKKDKQQMEVNA